MALMMRPSSLSEARPPATGSRLKPSSRQKPQQLQQGTCSLRRLGDTCEEALECGCPRRLSYCGCPQCCRELNNNSSSSPQSCCCDSSRKSSSRLHTSAFVGPSNKTIHSTMAAGCRVCQLAERLAEGARIAGGGQPPPEVGSPEPLEASQRCPLAQAALANSQKTVQPPATTRQNYSRVLSFRQRRLAMKLAPLGLRKRKPAPLPPLAGRSGRRGTSAAVDSSDSGNTSGAELNSHQEELRSVNRAAAAATAAATKLEAKQDNAGSLMKREEAGEIAPVKMLDETEMFAIEHFLRSHKSSSYVCRCMANLYLTGTRLDEAGRWSKPDSEGWRLSKTGVPVLTFDSGLTRNRPKRRLTISLCERGSGFVIWSDTIDHLSNYRAYSERLHGTSLDHIQTAGNELLEHQIDSFHLMYLSTNHRLMAGLSFDDAACARLFLKQVELISSDPANISLTGPKLARAKRPGRGSGSGLRLARLLACGARAGHQRTSGSGATTMCKSLQKSTTSSSQQDQQQQHQQQDHSWSTLRLACHLRVASRQKQPADLQNTPGARHPPPKSLAQQVAAAGAGLSWRRRPARKCDISAPCLFQHVTRVDAHCLERLHSGSLVAPTSCPTPDTPRAGHLNKSPSDAASSISSTSTTSSSSCYSTVGSQHASSTSGDWTTGARPKPPVRTTASSQNQNRQLEGPRAQPPPPPPPPPPEPTVSRENPEAVPQKNKKNRKPPEAAKIQAIIRELQAQSLGELVEAKRRLMADIAHRSGSISHL